ncbi:methyltransferase [Streptomyces canus]|uniref:methyltransferase n=1 Tax=Streptomyces canus TaxID=58343 RepID=UPI00037DF468|nr:methyltransferase [Streptomyces canus]
MNDVTIDRTGLFDIALNLLTARAIHVAAELRIADHLATGPASSARLAEATGTHEPSLYRLLRLLASVGLFSETAPRTFITTPRANALRSDIPGSLRPFVLHTLGLLYPAWGEMAHSIRTGEEAFTKAFGEPVWQYHADRSEANDLMNQVMSRESEVMIDDMVAAYDFSSFGTVVDVGGGEGALIAGVLAATPGVRGIVFDQPHVVSNALLRSAGLADRAKVVGGDFFDSVPGGGDAYILKWVLHDWNDENCIEILTSVRAAIPTGGTLLVAESVIEPGNDPAASKILDMVMLVLNGGQERTREQFETLLGRAGFHVKRVLPMVSSSTSLIEAIAVEPNQE